MVGVGMGMGVGVGGRGIQPPFLRSRRTRALWPLHVEVPRAGSWMQKQNYGVQENTQGRQGTGWPLAFTPSILLVPQGSSNLSQIWRPSSDGKNPAARCF